MTKEETRISYHPTMREVMSILNFSDNTVEKNRLLQSARSIISQNGGCSRIDCSNCIFNNCHDKIPVWFVQESIEDSVARSMVAWAKVWVHIYENGGKMQKEFDFV